MWVELPLRVPPGREQLGRRPAVVVGVPEEIQHVPYRVLVVVPLTRTLLRGPLFPLLEAGTGGLPADSTALVYQVAALDASRVVGKLGKLSADELGPIREGLRLMLKI